MGQVDLLCFPPCRQCWLALNDDMALSLTKADSTIRYVSLTEMVQIIVVVAQYKNVYTNIITSIIYTYKSTLK